MKDLGCFKTFRFDPLTAPTDYLSAEGGLDATAYEITLNVDCITSRRRDRMGGWRKLLHDTPYCYQNQDLHDQLIGCQFYYDSYSEVVSESLVVGYGYPYWFPGSTTGGYEEIQWTTLFCDYYPDFEHDRTLYDDITGYLTYGLFAEYSDGEGYWMNSKLLGWPYDYLTTAYTDACSYYDTDLNEYYVLSQFAGNYSITPPLEVIEPYAYGDQFQITFAYESYIRNYCGDCLNYQDGCREPITMIEEIQTQSGTRKVIAATKSRIYVNDAKGGNWRIIADRIGGHYGSHNCDCHPNRFEMAQIGNIVLLSNGIDPLLFWEIGDGPDGCNFWSADYVVDLALLDIESADCIAAWNGFAFIGNVVELGTRHESRLYWSDYNDPRSWAPTQESLAGYHEFGIGESIIAIKPIGGVVRVYTNKAIYDAILVGGDQVFHVREVYRGPDVPWFRNSVINLGDAHFYVGEDSAYFTQEHDGTPQRVEWVHRAVGVIFEGLDADLVDGFTAYLPAFGPVNKARQENLICGYDSERKTIWISWPTDDNNCPNMSLILNRQYGTSSLVDHGFTAFANYEVDYRPSIRDFFVSQGFCSLADLTAAKEGPPCDIGATEVDPPYFLVNETENPDLDPSINSICNNLSGVFIEDLCREMSSDSRFIMASAEDYCIKEFTPDQYLREQLVDYGWSYNCGTAVPGIYSNDGYTSMIQGGADEFGTPEEKLVRKVKVDFEADIQTTPNQIYAQVGFGSQPSCLQWTNPQSNELACLTDFTEGEHVTNKTRASDTPVFHFYRAGVYLNWRFYITGTGGGSSFNYVSIEARKKRGNW